MASNNTLDSSWTQPVAVDETAVEEILRSWSNTVPPIRPSKELMEVFRSVVRRSSPDRVLILGATPELIDMCIDEAVGRITSIERVIEVTAAMRRLGRRDWKGVELINRDWLDHYPELDGVFDVILCDGGLLFLDFPDAWGKLFANVARYLAPGGRVAIKNTWIPAPPPTFRDYLQQRLRRLDRERLDGKAGERSMLYRVFAAETGFISRIGAQRGDGSLDLTLFEEQRGAIAAEIEHRYADTTLHEFVARRLTVTARRDQSGKLQVRSFVAPDLGKPRWEDSGFTVEVVTVQGPLIPGFDHVYMATRNQSPR